MLFANFINILLSFALHTEAVTEDKNVCFYSNSNSSQVCLDVLFLISVFSHYSSFNDQRRAVMLHMGVCSNPPVAHFCWETEVPIALQKLKFITLQETCKAISLLLMLPENDFALHIRYREQKLQEVIFPSNNHLLRVFLSLFFC